MKTSPIPSILTALLICICTAGSTVQAGPSPHVCTNVVSLWRGLPQPILHLRFAGAALVLELGYRSACSRTAPARQPVTLRLNVTRSGKAELSILSHNLRLVVPRRSV